VRLLLRRLHDDDVLLRDLARGVEEERVGRVVVPRARAAPHEEDHARLAFGGLLDADRGRGEPRQVGEVLEKSRKALLDGFEPLELDQLVRHLVVDLDDRLLGVVEQDLVDVVEEEGVRAVREARAWAAPDEEDRLRVALLDVDLRRGETGEVGQRGEEAREALLRALCDASVRSTPPPRRRRAARKDTRTLLCAAMPL